MFSKSRPRIEGKYWELSDDGRFWVQGEKAYPIDVFSVSWFALTKATRERIRQTGYAPLPRGNDDKV